MKPRLLDLFCGAGGAAMGYHRAGFEVVGVDIKPQPNYPFEFHENVQGSPLRASLLLCGSMFALRLGDGYLRRHRFFESNVLVLSPQPCCHEGRAWGVYGHGAKDGKIGGRALAADDARKIMDMPWASRDGVAQAIPPAYTEYIGTRLMEYLNG